MSELLLDAAGRRRSPATLPEFHAGRPPRNKGMRYPADPPTIEEIVTVMRHARDSVHGRRLRGLIVVLWRAGLRICEALALTEADLDPRRGSLLARRGKGGRRREVGTVSMTSVLRRQLARAVTPRPAAGNTRLPRRRSSCRSPASNPVASGSQSAPFTARSDARGVSGLLRSRKEHSRSDMAELRKQA